MTTPVYAVTGASGRLGRLAVEQLTAHGTNTGYAGNGPQVMATLRASAISLLHLAGIT